ncbi:MAG: hypothetical protein SF123_07405 [Chloroflexota bacterium]|nr:hypothetical protein [Chloroflexota bacterium]
MKPTAPEHLPSLDELLEDVREQPVDRFTHLIDRLHSAMQTHRNPTLAWAETIFWLALIVAIFDHIVNQNGWVGGFIWALTIIPHEAGHLICNPFGVFIMFLGGTIWQVLFWLIAAAWYGFGRKWWRVALVSLMIVGHSFINASFYIADASAREMPLLFGLSSDHHDWWNILSMLGLLELDWAFAGIARTLGAFIVVGVALAGAYLTWVRSPAHN